MAAPIPYLRGSMLRDFQCNLLDQRCIIGVGLNELYRLLDARLRPATTTSTTTPRNLKNLRQRHLRT